MPLPCTPWPGCDCFCRETEREIVRVLVVLLMRDGDLLQKFTYHSVCELFPVQDDTYWQKTVIFPVVGSQACMLSLWPNVLPEHWLLFAFSFFFLCTSCSWMIILWYSWHTPTHKHVCVFCSDFCVCESPASSPADTRLHDNHKTAKLIHRQSTSLILNPFVGIR